MRKVILLMFISFGLHSCTNKVKTIAPQKMKLIMWDIITADEWLNNRNIKDSTVLFNKQNLSLYNKIFALQQTTKDEFYSSYTFYQKHPTLMKVLLDSLASYGIKKRDSLTNHLGK